MSPDPDLETIKRIASRDTGALYALMDKYAMPLSVVLLRGIEGHGGRDDVRQLFAKLTKRVFAEAARFDPERSSVSAWLRALAVEVADGFAKGN